MASEEDPKSPPESACWPRIVGCPTRRGGLPDPCSHHSRKCCV